MGLDLLELKAALGAFKSELMDLSPNPPREGVGLAS